MDFSTVTRFPGYCLDSRGKDQNSGIKPQSKKYIFAENCLKACNDPTGRNYLELTGCEYHKSKRTCSIHTAEVVSGGGNSNSREYYTCFVFENKRKFISFIKVKRGQVRHKSKCLTWLTNFNYLVQLYI